ncbi:MAG TPA: bifunctional phosphoribosylaminoimidazolecarboxamide formyltransferase/inosine monophosphate cyclohydrolase [Alphaproteobacteria bacterium]|nr:bifunctional phosphoribosylaminoimidazolecarboxamide formyltransferase/inosine monophosphate cyclohydrolase [Alphaproteobacteria bacterium]HAJ46859.1 bifunctional phosphoribosylaminoimidazolecarboxamide formyltransferase/inosine monophosphate cyclohydrolase [Alphaproteobacteria bacterium]
MSSPTLRPIKRALISVFDKSGLEALAQALMRHGIEVISTGGTAKALKEMGVAVTDVAQVTGFPEIMDGRVKTLHPKIHGGLLAMRDKPAHLDAMQTHGIAGIDLLVCNLYPFEETMARGAAFDEIVETIDIGGPAMIRAASKNHEHVCVLVQPQDYDDLIAELDAHQGHVGGTLRRKLAATAFARTAAYDTLIAQWLESGAGADNARAPQRLSVTGTLKQSLRYGENPHQSAAFYVTHDRRYGVATAEQLCGKELSYNNINDTDAAYELVAEFNPDTHAAVAIIKHANPCGVALADNLADAYRLALRCDPVSAFGGIVAVNRPLDGAAAAEIAKIFTEVVIAPDADDEARAIMAQKKNLRLLIAGGLPNPQEPGMTLRTVAGGFLVQTRDSGRVSGEHMRCVTKRQPTAQEMADLAFAFMVCKHVKSNAIVYAKDLATAGIGAGQMNRRDSSRIAALRAAEAAEQAGLAHSLAHGSVVASDAFFPFADGLIAAAEAGATAVIQPGGSIRDEEVIAAADERGLAMIFTGMRHFRH